MSLRLCAERVYRGRTSWRAVEQKILYILLYKCIIPQTDSGDTKDSPGALGRTFSHTSVSRRPMWKKATPGLKDRPPYRALEALDSHGGCMGFV